MVKTKNLSNPFSTGGGGGHFEAHVQASFVVLMITGGYAPCLPNWPIVEIKFQGKIDGFDTDDLIVFIENPENKERRKLLGQVKHSISVTKSDESFHEVIQAAWNDFNNPEVFIKDKDKIALITSPLNRTDFDNVQWLLNQVRHTKNVGEFFRNVEQANFSPSMSIKKLLVIQEHLNRANGGNEVSRDELYNFLKHFNLLSYDLGNEYGVVLSLLHSHISQFNLENPQLVWSRAVDIAQTWNQDGGTLTRDNLPEDLLEALQHKAITEMPKGLITSPETPKPDWAQHQDAIYLAFAVLMGAWNEKSKSDIDAITHMFGISYDIWLQKAQEILHHPASPLSFRNGVWRVVNRAELWKQLGSRILDQNLTTFKALAVSILKEIDPAFELSAEERFAASIHGKVLNYSLDLRKGIAEGLANLGSQPDLCSNCSQGIAEATCVLAIREILTDADWVQWGSLNSVLPILAEAAPSEFLDKVEKAMRQSPCPFDELFNQEGNGVFGENYLTGLLWALESLAWDEQHLVRVCVVLGELASRDPGGQWANRPSNSLITIFLPWLPQTLASVDKRKVAIQTLLFEWPDIAWNLLIKLLPGQQSTSSRSYKPIWRNSIPDDRGTGVSNQEYWQQVSFYSELAVESAGYNILRLNELIKHFDNLPKPAFDQLFNLLASPIITELPEDQRFLIWEHLIKFTNKHRRFPDAKWVLPTDLITRIETITERLAPTNPFYLYQTLFSENDFDLYESNDDWEEQQKILNSKRETAVANILQGIGVQKLILFSETVNSPEKVGNALGVIENESLEQTFFPQLLGSPERKHKALVSGFILRKYQINGWDWCDNLDKSKWAPEHIGFFLACLPFCKGVWDRAIKWLDKNQGEYWSRTGANPFQADDNLDVAIEKLIEHGRPLAAINCLDRLRQKKKQIDIDQCVRALLAASSSSETAHSFDRYLTIELIKFLQAEPSVDQEGLSRIEWDYLPLLDQYNEAYPKVLTNKLANNPEFFCEVIRLVYRSKKGGNQYKDNSDEIQATAMKARQLLDTWVTIPGTQKDGTFNSEYFNHWLQRVTAICEESGHLEVAQVHIGELLIHAPPDPGGLWIHKEVAVALNYRGADEIRNGFSAGALNTRGVHTIDPSGKQEKELAEQFIRKADDVENAGFSRFAVTLKELGEFYKREEKRIIDEYKDRDEE